MNYSVLIKMGTGNYADNMLTTASVHVTDLLNYLKNSVYLGSDYYSQLVNKLMDDGYSVDGWNYQVSEHEIYGSSRIGIHSSNTRMRRKLGASNIETVSENTTLVQLIRGTRKYELSNHLGNVQVIVSDKRVSVCNGQQQVVSFAAEVLMAVDYYPFGMQMPEREYYANADTSGYRFGFNGMEKDNEVKGAGNSQDFGARIYDSRLGRWFSVDPLRSKYPT